MLLVSLSSRILPSWPIPLDLGALSLPSVQETEPKPSFPQKNGGKGRLQVTLKIWGHLEQKGEESPQAHRLEEMVRWPRSTVLAREQLLTTSRSPPLQSVQWKHTSVAGHERGLSKSDKRFQETSWGWAVSACPIPHQALGPASRLPCCFPQQDCSKVLAGW